MLGIPMWRLGGARKLYALLVQGARGPYNRNKDAHTDHQDPSLKIAAPPGASPQADGVLGTTSSRRGVSTTHERASQSPEELIATPSASVPEGRHLS